MIVDGFRALARASSVPHFLLAADGEIRAVNQAASRLLGLPPSAVEGSNLVRWVEPSGPSLSELLKRLAKSGSALPGALTLRDGEGKPVECRGEGARVAGGPLGEATLVVLRLHPRDRSPSRFALLTRQLLDLRREVAARRYAELLLERQKSVLKLIVGNQPLGDVLTAICRFVEDHSERALCSILVLSDDGQRLLFGAAPSLPAAYNQAIDGLAIGPEVGSCGSAAYRGESVVVENIAEDPLWADFRDLAAEHDLAACWSQPVRGSHDEVLATLAMYYREPGTPSTNDLYLTSIGADLAAIAILSERSRHTLRRRAQQLAEADRRKDRFLAMLSHELRNPLAPIVNTLAILGRQAEERSELAQHVARLERQTTHLSRLVDDLLDISRIAHGAVELKVKPVDLRGTLAQAVDSVREAFVDRHQTLVVPEGGEALWVDGDGDRLRQVFANLLTNASKYTPAGGVVEIAAARDHGAIVVAVVDNGQGLAPEVRNQLFEPFMQGGTSAIDAREGLGLGLTLVQQLVECHGGSVEVESPGVGMGSTFTVRLPVSARSQPVAAAIGRPPELEAPALKVLVVEDNRDSVEALEVLLELWGHTTRVCFDGHAAVEEALKNDPDVILLDLDLPGRDGYGVLATLKERGFSTEDRLVVAMTGFGRLQDMEKTTAAGFDQHLIKPADPTLLRKLLADYALEKQRA